MLLFDDGKRLEKAIGEEAAQVIVSVLERMGEDQKKETATKADVREAELRLQGEIELTRKEIKEVELRLEAKIKEVELRLLKWQIGGSVALAAIMAKGFGWIGF